MTNKTDPRQDDLGGRGVAAAICGQCAARFVAACPKCEMGDVLAAARAALSEIVRGAGGRGAMARVSAAKLILARDFLAYLSDDELLAEVERRERATATRG